MNTCTLTHNLFLKAVECNWSLHGPGDWNIVEWEIYYDHTYATKVSFVPKYDHETHKKIDVAPIINTGKLDEKTFSELETLLNAKIWRDPNLEIRAYDGEGWKIDYYSPEGEIINSSGEFGYIYGEKLLSDIVDVLNRLQQIYRAPACVKVKKNSKSLKDTLRRTK